MLADGPNVLLDAMLPDTITVQVPRPSREETRSGNYRLERPSTGVTMKALLLASLTLAMTTAIVQAGDAKPSDPTSQGKQLASDNWMVRAAAAKALGKIGLDAMPTIRAALGSANANTRRGACEAITAATLHGRNAPLAQVRTEAYGMAPTLTKLLDTDTDAWVRTGAADVLRSFGTAAASDELQRVVVRILLDKTEDVWLRRSCLGFLKSAGLAKSLPAKTLVNVYMAATGYMDMMFCGGAIMPLGSMGDDAAPAIPLLISFVEDYCKRGVQGRQATYTVWTLAKLGATAEPALPALRRLAADGHGWVLKTYSTDTGEFIKTEAAKAIAEIEAAIAAEAEAKARAEAKDGK